MDQEETYAQALALLMELDSKELMAQADGRIEEREVAYSSHDPETAAELTKEIKLFKDVARAARSVQEAAKISTL